VKSSTSQLYLSKVEEETVGSAEEEKKGPEN
jgi:hypothetical protein